MCRASYTEEAIYPEQPYLTNILTTLSQWIPSIPALGLGRARATSNAATSVYFSGSAVALATGRNSTAVSGQLELSLRADPLRTLAEAGDKLTLQVESLEPSNKRCQMVLAPELYALSLMERPDVADDEVKEAVRWRMQENVEFPMDNASLDLFELPEAADRGKSMVFVAAMPTETLKTLVGEVHATGLEVETVDIAELSLRNVVHGLFPSPDQNMALLRVTSNAGMINVSRGEELFLSRRMAGVPGEFSKAAWEDYQDRLLLQVQRSIDYYESGMGQPPCSALLVAATHGWQEHIVEHLSDMLPLSVRTLSAELATQYHLQLHNPEPQDVNWNDLTVAQANAVSAGLPAIGGLLRGLRNPPMRQAA